jgi:hypothetical protein
MNDGNSNRVGVQTLEESVVKADQGWSQTWSLQMKARWSVDYKCNVALAPDLSLCCSNDLETPGLCGCVVEGRMARHVLWILPLE